MVEGGGSVLAQFLAEGLADELDLVVAPLFVGDPAAPRIAGLPAGNPRHRMHLAEVRLIGDVVLMRYLPGPVLRRAVPALNKPIRPIMSFMGEWWPIEVFHVPGPANDLATM